MLVLDLDFYDLLFGWFLMRCETLVCVVDFVFVDLCSTLVLVWIATYFCLITELFCCSLSFWVGVCITL